MGAGMVRIGVLLPAPTTVVADGNIGSRRNLCVFSYLRYVSMWLNNKALYSDSSLKESIPCSINDIWDFIAVFYLHGIVKLLNK